MNVETLIKQMEKRPEMYVGCVELESIVCFINGFMLSNFVANRMDAVEKKFKNEFHDWTKEQIEKSYNLKLEENRNYLFYLNQTNLKSEEKVKLFFELCGKFFKE